MRIRLRTIATIVAAGVFAATLAPPAAAFTTGAGTLSGDASVGKWFATICDKNGVGKPSGRGLYLPGTVTIPGVANGDDTREEGGVWRFGGSGMLATGTTQGGAHTTMLFSVNACGFLSAVTPNDPNNRFDGIGASCGASKGHHGQGNILFGNGQRIKLYNLGWKTAAGGTLPLSGQYREYADDSSTTGAKKQKRGTVEGQLQAQGGAACLGWKSAATNNGNGAQTFTVTGNLKFLNMVTPPKKAEPKQCKNYADPATFGPGGKKSHDNKAGDHTCTPADGGDKP